jgi:23S rRNA pseudouridine2457 synthase
VTVIALWKPYDVVCQFTVAANAKPGQKTLANYVDRPGMYPAGRLDRDSEGLVLLTDDGRLQARLTSPNAMTSRTYLIQVEGVATEETIRALTGGTIVVGGSPVRRCSARVIHLEPDVPPRDPPIRHRVSVPTSWIELSLTEGRNRQVRHMTAATGHPTLRLIRIAHGSVTIDGLTPGETRELSAAEVEELSMV